MKREIITTADGSATIHLPDWNEHYHSKHGAIQEAYHVFIEHGLALFNNEPVALLEIGFGTGLNAFITYLESQKRNLSVRYVGVEAYPVLMDEIKKLNYTTLLKAENEAVMYEQMHKLPWNEPYNMYTHFSLEKRQQFFDTIDDKEAFNLIYFDAFGARVQPELWTEDMFKIMYDALKTAGVLVTYSAKGSVRRAMQSVGFSVERLPGPPGKREMLRATKIRDES